MSPVSDIPVYVATGASLAILLAACLFTYTVGFVRGGRRSYPRGQAAGYRQGLTEGEAWRDRLEKRCLQLRDEITGLRKDAAANARHLRAVRDADDGYERVRAIIPDHGDGGAR